MTGSMTNSLQINSRFLLILIIILTAFSLYGKTVNYQFVWDDHYLIDENPKIQHAASIKDFFRKDFWENSSNPYDSGYYRPLTLLSFFINHKISNGTPGGFHLFNIILHAANGVLLFLIIFQVTKRNEVAFLTGLLFIVHPIQSEAVAFISDVGDLLCAFFLLTSIYNYLRFVLDSGSRVRYVISLISLSMAFLCKENAMVGFFLIVLIDFTFVSRSNLNALIKRSKLFLPYVLLTVVYIIFRVFILGGVNAVTNLSNIRYVSVLPSFDWYTHMLTVIKIVMVYVGMFVAPLEQSISYVILPSISIFDPRVLFGIIFFISIIFLSWLSLKAEERFVGFGVIWFAATLLPLSNLIPIGNVIAERFMYLPSIGLCFLCAGSIEYYDRKFSAGPGKKVFISILFVLAVVTMYDQSSKRISVWESDFTLFKSAALREDCSPIGHKNLDVTYFRNKEYIKAARERKRYEACRDMYQKQYRDLKEAYFASKV